jgi:hypothetical protein
MVNQQLTNTVYLKGFFTLKLYLLGQTLREIEQRMGFDAGRLSLGAWFATPLGIPSEDEFELAGYSQVAGHHTREQYGDNLNNPGTDGEKQAYAIQKRNVIQGWQLYGTNQLIKVLPMIGHSINMSDDFQYPPGTGIPQWKMIKPILCRGLFYSNTYPGGRFTPV